MSHADSVDNVETIGRLKCGGMVEMREVIPRQMLGNRLNSSTAEYILRASVPCGSRINSTLSRNRIISLEDKNGRRGVRSSGFSIPAPMTVESRLRRWGRDAGN